MVTGQAAGTAAALSVRQDVAPRYVDIPALQKELRAQGVKIGSKMDRLQYGEEASRLRLRGPAI